MFFLSALDSENEFLVQEALERLMEGASLCLFNFFHLTDIQFNQQFFMNDTYYSFLCPAPLIQSIGRTVMIIAHRLSTIKNANAVAVLDQRRVAECGQHTELLGNRQGLFRKLMEKQTFLQEGQKQAMR